MNFGFGLGWILCYVIFYIPLPLSIWHLACIHNHLLLNDPFSFAYWSFYFIDFISYIHILLVNSLSINPTLITYIRCKTWQITDKQTIDHQPQ